MVALQAPGDSSRWFIVERQGRISAFANKARVSTSTTFLDITDRVILQAETGLLGMAFHPNFPADSRVFVQYTTEDASSVLYTHVSSFTSTDGGRTLDPTSEQVVLRLQQKTYRHKAGTIAFGPDGYLYIGLGEDNHRFRRQSQADQAQNTLSWYGKMLRIDVDNGTPYAIPSDNPFASGKGGAREVYAWGFRNPWQWHFDKVTGDLWLGDVGRLPGRKSIVSSVGATMAGLSGKGHIV